VDVDRHHEEVSVSRGGVSDLHVVIRVERMDDGVYVFPRFQRGGIEDNIMSLAEFKQALTMLQEGLDAAHVAYPKIFRKQEVEA
jgi:hypothetical protein